jgi:hypothetical protein
MSRRTVVLLVVALAILAAAPARAALPGELRGPAPWPANQERLDERLAAIGLPALPQEGFAVHIHAHLDVFVNGKRVRVPAGIGIADTFISPLHTHDASGIVHVESPTVRRFTLGQVLAVWGVRFRSHCLGGYCAGGNKLLRVYANGKLVTNPSSLRLTSHQEIVLAFGTKAQLSRPLPKRYAFPPGL